MTGARGHDSGQTVIDGGPCLFMRSVYIYIYTYIYIMYICICASSLQFCNASNIIKLRPGLFQIFIRPCIYLPSRFLNGHSQRK